MPRPCLLFLRTDMPAALIKQIQTENWATDSEVIYGTTVHSYERQLNSMMRHDTRLCFPFKHTHSSMAYQSPTSKLHKTYDCSFTCASSFDLLASLNLSKMMIDSTKRLS